ncbi:hypothetical protein [Zeimonas arvi]|uniref:Uncharacterized protein n=1 Tax=Zeimonas arvi TaxID=2498847 RepID=A0A5C8NU34_9BURK|nr:hypothetical protein [Zeimonas arvi]TXL64675.1 hypothetical protein FHP08_13085 [Zeimonas arvi]
MYEIWLALNIVFELALAHKGLVIGYLAALLALLLAARSGAWRRGLPLAVALGLLVAMAAFALLPSLTASSFGNVAYWIDWANLAAIALGIGGGAALLAWPLAALAKTGS